MTGLMIRRVLFDENSVRKTAQARPRGTPMTRAPKVTMSDPDDHRQEAEALLRRIPVHARQEALEAVLEHDGRAFHEDEGGDDGEDGDGREGDGEEGEPDQPFVPLRACSWRLPSPDRQQALLADEVLAFGRKDEIDEIPAHPGRGAPGHEEERAG